jgi:hypothetical protein
MIQQLYCTVLDLKKPEKCQAGNHFFLGEIPHVESNNWGSTENPRQFGPP